MFEHGLSAIEMPCNTSYTILDGVESIRLTGSFKLLVLWKDLKIFPLWGTRT